MPMSCQCQHVTAGSGVDADAHAAGGSGGGDTAAIFCILRCIAEPVALTLLNSKNLENA